MTQLIYISRAFVEFGPFSAKEILDFETRGLLRDTDYVRPEGVDDWVHVLTWITDSAAKAKPAANKKPKAPAKPKAAKKVPAKKAAAKPKSAKNTD